MNAVISDYESIMNDVPASWEAVWKESKASIEHPLRKIGCSKGYNRYPPKELIYNAFHQTRLDKVRVVIVGQDPYHSDGQAMGLSFSVNKGVPIPPSLANIFKLCAIDIPGYATPEHGDLTSWANQGVLLLNTGLTVVPGSPGSDKGIWMSLIANVLKAVLNANPCAIFVLWGKDAKEISTMIGRSARYILTSVHPSPLSAYRGFFECGHFKRINEILASQPIDWEIK